MSYIKTTKTNDYAEGLTVNIDPATLYTTSTSLVVDYGADGTVDSTDVKSFSYNEVGQKIGEYAQYFSGDGQLTYQGWTTYEYNDLGGLVREETVSPDFNGDGNPDNSSVKSTIFTDSGRVASEETTWYFDGFQSPTDYRLETFTYLENDLLDVWTIDDWSLLDFEIAYDYDYDALNRLTSISYQDPFIYGDEEFHPRETWTHNANGSVTYSNFSGATEWGNFAELTTKLTYPSSQHRQELIEGKDETGAVVFRALEEQWSNKLGAVTDVLTSYDINLDSKFTPGAKSGYQDYRDRERLKYSDVDGDGLLDLSSHTIDEHNNKVIDYSMTIEILPDMLMA